MKNRIAIIAVYFGPLPNYLPLWLKSCEYNDLIDFYLITDQNVAQHPSNVIVKPMTLGEMKNRAQSILQFDVSLERPYKCCDFKVIYGLIFQDYVKDYDYWGHCDLDLIWGDLSYFFQKYNLYNYDKFLVLGHLSLYRNTDDVNNAFRKDGCSKDFHTIFSNDKSYAFDEKNGIYRIMLHNNYKVFDRDIYIDITTLYKRYRCNAECYNYQTYYWKEGKIYYIYYDEKVLNTKEYMYIHFQKRPNYELTFDCKDVKEFYITNSGFYIKDKEPSIPEINKLNPYRGKLYEMIEKTYNVYKKRIMLKLKSWKILH